MSNKKKYHTFLGLCAPTGLIPVWRQISARLPAEAARWQPWYKLHLTLHFWGELTRAEFFELLTQMRTCPALKNPLPRSMIRGVDIFTRYSVLYFRETSPQIHELQQTFQAFISTLPEHLRGEIRKEFHPHWTIARKFFPENARRLGKLSHELEAFEHNGQVPAIELFFSSGGIYEPHSLHL